MLIGTTGALTVATLGFMLSGWWVTRLAVQAESESVWQRFNAFRQAYVLAVVGILAVEFLPGIASFIADLATWFIQIW